MTSNQRRPGFRLPWSAEADGAEPREAEPGTQAAAPDGPAAEAPAVETAIAGHVAEGAAEMEAPATDAGPSAQAEAVVETATEPTPTRAAQPEAGAGFMRDLVAAMRRVAEETRQSGLSDLRTKAEEQVRSLEADAEHRREELKTRAEADIAGVGDWAKAETERVTKEAEQRVVARRAQLDQQLAGETTRAEAEAKTLRDRVAEYERELDAYHAQLSDIADPAAFAAAAKRMPSPPQLRAPTPPPTQRPEAAPTAAPAPTPAAAAETNDAANPTPGIHPTEEEVLASRLAELDAELGPVDAVASQPANAEQGAPTATEIVVKGLGSFGAITGFRQSLASVEGVDGVSLSLGPTGEFVFRAIHPQGFDLAAAIATLEGDAARIEPQANGGLKVTLDRAR